MLNTKPKSERLAALPNSNGSHAAPAQIGDAASKPRTDSARLKVIKAARSNVVMPAVKKNYAGVSSTLMEKVVVPSPPPKEFVILEPDLRPEAPAKKRSLRISYVLLGIVLLGAGLALTWNRAVSELRPQEAVRGSSPDKSGDVAAAGKELPNVSPLRTGAAASLVLRNIHRETRPTEFVEALGANKMDFRFMPASKLNFENRPMRLYCLLRARLDAETESRWRSAGMLSDEVVPSTFLLPVEITNAAVLSNLYDWHVEAVSVRSEKGH